MRRLLTDPQPHSYLLSGSDRRKEVHGAFSSTRRPFPASLPLFSFHIQFQIYKQCYAY